MKASQQLKSSLQALMQHEFYLPEGMIVPRKLAEKGGKVCRLQCRKTRGHDSHSRSLQRQHFDDALQLRHWQWCLHINHRLFHLISVALLDYRHELHCCLPGMHATEIDVWQVSAAFERSYDQLPGLLSRKCLACSVG